MKLIFKGVVKQIFIVFMTALTHNGLAQPGWVIDRATNSTAEEGRSSAFPRWNPKTDRFTGNEMIVAKPDQKGAYVLRDGKKYEINATDWTAVNLEYTNMRSRQQTAAQVTTPHAGK